jgi:L-alanine-DL-glutamate epimerase-like enolase superfamily enzyme
LRQPVAGDHVHHASDGRDPERRRLRGILDRGYAIADGKATIPDSPGWGVEIAPDWLDASHHQISELD